MIPPHSAGEDHLDALKNHASDNIALPRAMGKDGNALLRFTRKSVALFADLERIFLTERSEMATHHFS